MIKGEKASDLQAYFLFTIIIGKNPGHL